MSHTSYLRGNASKSFSLLAEQWRKLTSNRLSTWMEWTCHQWAISVFSGVVRFHSSGCKLVARIYSSYPARSFYGANVCVFGYLGRQYLATICLCCHQRWVEGNILTFLKLCKAELFVSRQTEPWTLSSSGRGNFTLNTNVLNIFDTDMGEAKAAGEGTVTAEFVFDNVTRYGLGLANTTSSILF